MIFAPIQLGRTSVETAVLASDKKKCKRFGPCGVGEKALYLNSFFIDRRYYVSLSSVRRVFKRIAMSKGGFTGKGVFGAMPYLVVEYDDGKQKQCNFKHEEDVDRMLAYIRQTHPEIPLHSVEAERRLAEKSAREAARYLTHLSPEAAAAKATLERAKEKLEQRPDLSIRMEAAAKAKRINDRTNPAYKWVALAIMLAGAVALVYGIYTLAIRDTSGLYFTLLGLAALFMFSGAQVLPTAKNNKKAVAREWEEAKAVMDEYVGENFPVPHWYAHPVVLTRMIRILREGRAQSVDEALAVLKADLKALTSDVQVEQEEYDEVIVIKPLFLLSDYQ